MTGPSAGSHTIGDASDPVARLRPVREQVAVGPLRLRIARPPSAEDLIDEDDYARDERLPYWAELWPSARVLAERLAVGGRPATAGRRVVELGCGVGVPAIVAALAGADVLATDWYEEALAFTRHNAAANGARLGTLHVDWNAPPPALLDRPAADLVIGADLLYEARNGGALAALLPRILRPGGEALVADPRRPHADALIDPLVAAGWRHDLEEVRYAGRPDESGSLIRLHRLIAPGG
ncbi:class I SAM-dependent methyltransferase [Miltoncostaea marina]|uniref:class I SAM-dependent methyltransferase n=1 Tax=Miltoncostaea marina TaxID=2843215 RepID=UPI001C3C2FA9|nr:methyltransferase domain-containing protein [Miltoncostaea marina]